MDIPGGDDLRVKVDRCFTKLIDALFVPGLHSREAVQEAADFIHGLLNDTP